MYSTNRADTIMDYNNIVKVLSLDEGLRLGVYSSNVATLILLYASLEDGLRRCLDFTNSPHSGSAIDPMLSNTPSLFFFCDLFAPASILCFLSAEFTPPRVKYPP